MAQTAVEFYADKQLELHQKLKDNKISMIDFVIESRGLLIEAKQMEREQHKDTWDAGMSEGIGTTMGSIDYDGEFINYYTQTYGK